MARPHPVIKLITMQAPCSLSERTIRDKMTEKILIDHIVITIPVYNEIRFIKETLASLARQTFTKFKVLISDNASTDGTSEACQEFCANDPRFHYVRQSENIGAGKNFLYCFDASDSDYFMWLGAHDVLHPDFLRLAIERIESNDQISLVYGFTRWIDETGVTKKITNGGDYVFQEPLGALDRYLKVLYNLNMCEPVNQLIRRKFLDLKMEVVISFDLPIMCHLAAHGPYSRIDTPLYWRREFNRASTSMGRILGTEAVKANHTDLAWNFMRSISNHSKLNSQERLIAVARTLDWLDKKFNVLKV